MRTAKGFEDDIYRDGYQEDMSQEDLDFYDELPDEEFERKSGGRSRGERRKKDIRKAKRKKRIAEEVYGRDYYDNLHEYSKNKIHCSCPMCSGVAKTNSKKVNKGGAKPQTRYSGFGTTNHKKGKNYKHSEVRKVEMMDAQEKEREI